jgi:hypothetical protein
MNKKNLIVRIANPVNRITIDDLPAEMVELSEKNLQEIFGGCCNCFCFQPIEFAPIEIPDIFRHYR